MPASLDGLQVLVTRPAAQADHLCELLEQAGAQAEALPVMEIVAFESTESLARLSQASAWDMMIFVSRNAVEFALPFLDKKILPDIVAIGRKTAEALQQQEIHVDIVPPRFNSESLLAMSVMQSVTGKRVMIVRGCGGREKLASSLRQRGATVEYAEVYRRTRPDQNAVRLQSLLAHQKIDAITVASGDALQNLVKLAGDEQVELFALPLIVMSERLVKLAQQAGFADTDNIYVAPEASDEGLVAALRQWRQQEDVSS